MSDSEETIRMRMSVSDRVALENRIDRFVARVEQHITEQRKRADDFYAHRMLPLEASVAQNRARMWFALGMCAATFLIVLVLLAELLIVRR